MEHALIGLLILYPLLTPPSISSAVLDEQQTPLQDNLLCNHVKRNDTLESDYAMPNTFFSLLLLTGMAYQHHLYMAV